MRPGHSHKRSRVRGLLTSYVAAVPEAEIAAPQDLG